MGVLKVLFDVIAHAPDSIDDDFFPFKSLADFNAGPPQESVRRVFAIESI